MALWFLVLALPTVLVQVYLTPPIQVADEENHFLRSLQIADGHLFGHLLADGNAGGTLDPAAPGFAHAFDALKFRPDVKLDPATYAAAAALGWHGGPEASAAFPNTAIYPFFLYLPASGGIGVGRALHASVLDSFYLGRLVTALAAVALSSLALAVCGRGRTVLFVILCFPMSLSLFASVSQDALAIALAAVASATWSGYAARDVGMPAPIRAMVALALGAVAAARIPLVPLYVLALTPTRSSRPGGAGPRLVDGAAAAAGVVPFAVGLHGVHVAKTAFREANGVSPLLQLRWLGLHPVQALEVAARTLEENTLRHLREMIGVLGWLDTDLPAGFYVWVAISISVAIKRHKGWQERSIAGVWRFVPVAGVLLSVASVFGAFYLAWTPVGAPIVDGVQGRYFIVPALVLATSLPGLASVAPWRPHVVETLRLILCGAVALADLWIVPTTLLHRYYG